MSKWGTWYDLATNLTPLTTLDVGRWVINLEKACLSLSKTIDQSRDPKIEEHSVATHNETEAVKIRSHEYDRKRIFLLSIGLVLLIFTIRKIVRYSEKRWLED
jgi:hypothetical protein